MAVNFVIPELGDKYQDDRDRIPGDSYNWGPVIIATKIVNLTYHHTVTAQTAKNDGNWKAECDKVANIHINTNGWGGVGYRWIICSDGTLAYVGDLSHGGSAVGGKNDIMFSAAFIGDFTKELPTAYQVHSAHVLAKYLLTQSPQYPNLSSWDQVKGHKEFSSTACPGNNWKVSGDSLYDRIKNDNWQGYPDPKPATPPAPVPTPTPPPVFNDDTPIPVNGEWGTMKIVDIRGKLDEQKKDLSDFKIAKDKFKADLKKYVDDYQI